MDSRYCSIQSHLSLDVATNTPSFLSSNQATELTRLGSIAESPSKDNIIFKLVYAQTNRQLPFYTRTSICSTHRPYISINKKESPP